jgi:5-(carboxyamino)imidazole ribonucleotide synthase
MTALAAARLGYRCHVLAPEVECPAADVAARTRAAYEDEAALERFARAVDVVTLELENVPVTALERLAALVPVRPGPAVLAMTQDRLLEKRAVEAAGIAVAPFWPVDGAGDLGPALAAAGGHGILKTRRLGYDGRGQARVDAGGATAAWQALGAMPAILEAVVGFAREVSVITARGPDGALRSFPPVENRHQGGILRETLAPAALPPALAAEAVLIAETLAARLDVVGLLAVEMFLTRDDRLVVNELAPRPHNSGHWTLDACATSQFEQHVRAVCGLPLGDPAPLAAARMTNILGEEVLAWPALLAEPGARVHLYGKREVRAGRKLGHVTRLAPLPADRGLRR